MLKLKQTRQLDNFYLHSLQKKSNRLFSYKENPIKILTEALFQSFLLKHIIYSHLLTYIVTDISSINI